MIRAKGAAAAAILLAALAGLGCGRHEKPGPDDGAHAPAPAPAGGPAANGESATGPSATGPSATGSSATGAASPADAGAGAVTIDSNPRAPSAVPGAATPPGGAPSTEPAPGTLSLRFIVRKHENKEELPAGGFEVRLLPLDAIRDGASASGRAAGESGSPADARVGVTTEAPRPVAGIGPAAGPGATAGTTYQGSPEQVLVTQLDGSKRTYLAGVRPGTYAMRITAKGRRMLLEVLTVKPEDRLVERSLEAE